MSSHKGINRLVDMECYEDAFPLHDGNIPDDFEFHMFDFNPENDEVVDNDRPSMRQVLRRSWARAGKTMFCIQPLEQIMQYFGATTARVFCFEHFVLTTEFLSITKIFPPNFHF